MESVERILCPARSGFQACHFHRAQTVPARPYPMLIRDTSKGLARVSAALGQQLGYSHTELASEPMLHWIHPEDAPQVREAVAARAGIVQGRHATRSGQWLALTLTV